MSEHRTPTTGEVIREQFNAIAVALRIPIFIASALLIVVTFLAFSDYLQGRGGVEFAPELSMIPAFVGALLPIAVWQRDRPFGARFIWTLPIDRTRHALAKMFAGWLWLMIAVTAFVLWILILALITKGTIKGDEMVRLLPTSDIPPPGTLDASMLRTVTWIPQPALWLTPFTAATALYVIVSAGILGLRHPFRWILGAIAGGFLVAAVGQGLESEAFWSRLASVMRTLMEGRYGVDALLTAHTESLHTSVTLSNGQATTVWRGLPVVTDWLIATLLWTSLGTAALCAALYRNRERR
jgi:hypothetical protein